ncbi:MAG: head-tail adaptor protein [Proteobacteria bacterium]|nr:head-tail adaptor protein [Pseudomonadota bacterium]
MQPSNLPGAGELNRRIVIRLRADVPNAAFGLDQTASTVRVVYAKYEPIHGLALRAGMQTGEEATDLFFVRHAEGTRPQDLTADHIIDFNGRRYRIMDSIDIGGAGRFTRITTKDLGAI